MCSFIRLAIVRELLQNMIPMILMSCFAMMYMACILILSMEGRVLYIFLRR